MIVDKTYHTGQYYDKIYDNYQKTWVLVPEYQHIFDHCVYFHPLTVLIISYHESPIIYE